MIDKIKRSEQGSSEPHLVGFSCKTNNDTNLREEQLFRMEALSIIRKKKVEAYDLVEWSLNPFHLGSTPIFALEERRMKAITCSIK